MQREQIDIAGSWHSRGFHGHERAKSRIEFSTEYRKLAKPTPPERFRSRERDDMFKHVFSVHDNRQVFLNDAQIMGQGLGKRKIESKYKSKWNPEFIAWVDDSGRDRFKNTIYQKDFCNTTSSRCSSGTSSTSNQSTNMHHHQPTKLLSATIGRSAPPLDAPVSVYSCNFSQTYQDNLRSNLDDTNMRFRSKIRPKSCFAERVNVASCLIWH